MPIGWSFWNMDGNTSLQLHFWPELFWWFVGTDVSTCQKFKSSSWNRPVNVSTCQKQVQRPFSNQLIMTREINGLAFCRELLPWIIFPSPYSLFQYSYGKIRKTNVVFWEAWKTYHLKDSVEYDTKKIYYLILENKILSKIICIQIICS